MLLPFLVLDVLYLNLVNTKYTWIEFAVLSVAFL